MVALTSRNYNGSNKDTFRAKNINEMFKVIISYNNEHARNVAHHELYNLLKEYGLNKNNVRIMEIKIQNNWPLDFWTVSLK